MGGTLLPVVVCVGLGYLSGALPWGLWLGLLFRGVDVRTVGSRNLGATNVFRSLGRVLGVTTLVLDILKGAVPVVVVPSLAIAVSFPGGIETCRLAVGLAAVVGHVWTVFAGFRGGKGVATTVGVLLAVSPPAFAAFLAVFAITVLATRYISLGSILGSVAFAITLGLIARGGLRSPTFAFGVVVATLVVVRHRDNIARLIRGQERRFSWRRSPAS